MLTVRRDRLPGEVDEVHDVGGGDHPILGRGEFELRPVGRLTLASFVRADSIGTLGPQQTRDVRRQVLVEIDLHSTEMNRTSPGNSFSRISGVSRAFAMAGRARAPGAPHRCEAERHQRRR